MPKEKKKKDSKESKKEKALKVDVAKDLDSESSDIPGDVESEPAAPVEVRAPELKVTMESLDPEASRTLHELEKSLPSITSRAKRRRTAAEKKSRSQEEKPRKTPAKKTAAGRPASPKAAARASVSKKTSVVRSPLGEQDVYLFREGTHRRLFEKFGAHPGSLDGNEGTFFAVWAPSASRVSIIGDFN